MPRLIVSAVLTDADGSVLLMRRKRSVLWRLPGGETTYDASIMRLLVSLCRRQVGVAPDFVDAPFTFEFAGQRVIVACDEVPNDKVRACGWVDAVQWFRPDALPLEIEPVAAVAISLRHDDQARQILKRRPMMTADQTLA